MDNLLITTSLRGLTYADVWGPDTSTRRQPPGRHGKALLTLALRGRLRQSTAGAVRQTLRPA